MTARRRVRDFGVVVGIMPTGDLNAITDVPGVRVGHVTIVQGESIRTGVTAILPHSGNLHAERVPAGVAVGNGYGKFAGSTQVEELGELESPIVLTNTLSVGAGIEGIVRWTLAQPGNENVRAVNAVVGETNDGFLNDIRTLSVRPEHVLRALDLAKAGSVLEGSVGAGTGTQAFGWKGGIGTSSRRVFASKVEHTVGVLVQTNFGGVLTVAGAPVGQELGGRYLPDELSSLHADGSVVIVVATNAPMSDRNLARLARRVFLALGRTGSPMTNGSGDYAIALSTALSVRRLREGHRCESGFELTNEEMSPMFLAVIEATEEAVYNSMFTASSMNGHRGVLTALPCEKVVEILRRHDLLSPLS